MHKYTTHRVCDHTFTDTQSLYTTTNSTVTGAQTFCTNNTFIHMKHPHSGARVRKCSVSNHS